MPRDAKTALVHFTEEDADLYDRLDNYCALTGASRSSAIRRLMRAVVDRDDKVLGMFRTFPKPRALHAARREHASA